jgi:hypothetical protein
MIKNLLKDNIELDEQSFAGSKSDSCGELLRLVFHDVLPFVKGSGSMGGLNGCVDLVFASNAGTQSSIQFVEETRSYLLDTANIAISTADLFVLAAIVSIEATGGPTNIPRCTMLELEKGVEYGR